MCAQLSVDGQEQRKAPRGHVSPRKSAHTRGGVWDDAITISSRSLTFRRDERIGSHR